jgi:nucleoside-diphosphate kinase
MEQTFVMIKPDGVQRNLVGEILNRFEKKGFKICALKLMRLSEEKASEHYSEHKGKPFYDDLISFITSSPVTAMVLEGKDAVMQVRKMIGATNPLEADVGTIRGDYGLLLNRNIVHASDSKSSALREINIFFRDEEIIKYEKYIEKSLK